MQDKKFNTGAVIGKFLPPHMGHVALIEKALEQCHSLFVVISDNAEKTEKLCEEGSLPFMNAELRKKWLIDHFAALPHAKFIKFLVLDENNLKPFPTGAAEFAKRLTALVPAKIDALFYGEDSKIKDNKKYFPDTEMIVIERGVATNPDIQGSSIRKNWLKFKNFMLEGAVAFLSSMPQF